MRFGQHVVHSAHAPSVEVWSVEGDSFTWGHTRSTPLRSGIGSVLHVADTHEEAEAWRARRLEEIGRR